MKKTELFFPFEPVPKGRPKFTKSGHSYTPQKTRDFERDVQNYYRENANDFYDGAIRVYMTFFMPIPTSVSKKKRVLMVSNTTKHTKRPDSDNLAKAIADGLNGVAYADDSQITVLHIEKRYGEQVGVLLRIIEDID